MKNFLLTLLITLAFAVPVHAAWQFDGSNDYVDMAASTATDLNDADWSIAGWVQTLSLAGSDGSYVYTSLTSQFGTDGSYGSYVYQDSFATTGLRGEMQWDTVDDGTLDSLNVATTGNPFTSNTAWTHVRYTRSGNTITLYINGVADGNGTNSSYDAVTPNNGLRFGGHFALVETKFLNGRLAEWTKQSKAMSVAEGQSLALGAAPNCLSWSGMTQGNGWYIPARNEYREVVNGLTVTNNGSALAAHPRIINCGE